MDDQFGCKFSEKANTAKKLLNDIRNSTKQTQITIAKDDYKSALTFQGEMSEQIRKLKTVWDSLSTIPYVIDFSKLSNIDWKRVGIPGIHYKTRLFLSYHFRDINPAKDANQQLIDYFVIPLLKILDIEPVTARSCLKSQELIEDDIIKLVKECDGIIGIYTSNDPIANVEHEVASSSKIIALCIEEGANFPKMRNSRLQINFRRAETAILLIDVAKSLRDNKMFNLKTDDLLLID